MRLYRVGGEKYLNVFNGLGASYQKGARWNHPGDPVIYFATSQSIALLEMANYLASPRHVPPRTRLGVYELPDSVAIETLPEALLPPDWRAFPHPESTREIGSRWLRKGAQAGLVVPSTTVPVVVAGEGLVVVNPGHPDIKQLTLIDASRKIYSDRMFEGMS